MAGGRIPINQLNALPIISASQWISTIVPSAPTQQGIVGNKLVKYWAPAASGINGKQSDVLEPREPAPNRYYMVSNWLDLTGCDVLTLVLGSRFGAGATDIAQVWNVFTYPYGTTSLGAAPMIPEAAPNYRNMTGPYARTPSFPLVTQLLSPILGTGPVAGDVKLCAASCRIGVSGSGFGTAPALGLVQLLLQTEAATANTNLFQYLTVWAQG